MDPILEKALEKERGMMSRFYNHAGKVGSIIQGLFNLDEKEEEEEEEKEGEGDNEVVEVEREGDLENSVSQLE